MDVVASASRTLPPPVLGQEDGVVAAVLGQEDGVVKLISEIIKTSSLQLYLIV